MNCDSCDEPKNAWMTALTVRPDAAIAEMVDVVHVPASLVQLDEVPDDLHEVLLREHRQVARRVEAEALVDLVPADAAEVVALRAEEQALERLLGRQRIGRVAGPQQAVDLLERQLLAGLGIDGVLALLAV